MREILFRGKNKHVNEWVEGSVFIPTLGGEVCIVVQDAPFHSFCYDVHPDTVGQYTGLMDKNGKRIFEGDLVRYTERKLNGSDAPCVNPVEFAEGGWAVDCWFLNNWLYDGKNGNIQLDVIEVIGNIHDNPELLRGAE